MAGLAHQFGEAGALIAGGGGEAGAQRVAGVALGVEASISRQSAPLAELSLDVRHPASPWWWKASPARAAARQAAPAVPGVLRLVIAGRPAADTPLRARERAMLLMGFGAALCRSSWWRSPWATSKPSRVAGCAC